MSRSPLLLQERDEGVLTLTLNLPEQRNPVSDEAMVDALCEALGAADRDIGVRAVVLTGAGRVFSAGGNLKAMQVPDAGGLRAALPAQTRRNYRYGILRLPTLFQALEVPVVAAVNGAAIGAGCDLACMCDIRIAGVSASSRVWCRMRRCWKAPAPSRARSPPIRRTRRG